MKSLNGGEQKELEISLEALRNCLVEEQNGYLKGEAVIAGWPFHVEAIEIYPDKEINEAVNPVFWSRIDALENEMQGSFKSIELDGKLYILAITPFCR